MGLPLSAPLSQPITVPAWATEFSRLALRRATRGLDGQGAGLARNSSRGCGAWRVPNRAECPATMREGDRAAQYEEAMRENGRRGADFGTILAER
jgi:hypothetical protein